eukprot:TRINITY_DN132_c0_g1_i3.p1 TRINITY_DN132_c0_g1~~TRINITY_DN132_c0_g1_i3.p1  ORF type:complete len:108 (+),score=11.69 TRINITY_DN132_c0_g1_i3:81-404(+)
MSEKLQKVLARAGHGSRRELEGLIKSGRVSVNGQVAKLGERLEDENSVIRIDGHTITGKASEEVVCRVLATTNLKVSFVLVTIQKVAVLFSIVYLRSVVLVGFQLVV